jgi:hypothetical protein
MDDTRQTEQEPSRREESHDEEESGETIATTATKNIALNDDDQDAKMIIPSENNKLNNNNTKSSDHRRRVHWSPYCIQVQEHIHRNDLTPEEISDAWMSYDEMEAILNDPWTQAFMVGQMAKRWVRGWW